MHRETLERALHAWPEWGKSIRNAQAEVAFDPKHPLDERGLRRHQHRWFRVKELAFRELARLELPSRLHLYWMACFFADCENADGSVNYQAIVKPWLTSERILPPHPYELHLPTWDPDRRCWRPFRLEGHIGLATREMLTEAVLNLLHCLTRFYEYDPHPLMQYVPSAKARRSERKACAVERYSRGKVTFTDLLREEYWSEEVQGEIETAVSPRRARLERERVRERAQREARKRAYDRVRSWLTLAGFHPERPERDWWLIKP